jgi:hypothetical protein
MMLHSNRGYKHVRYYLHALCRSTELAPMKKAKGELGRVEGAAISLTRQKSTCHPKRNIRPCFSMQFPRTSLTYIFELNRTALG